MTDHLERLLLRGSGRLPTVRPRIAALYEDGPEKTPPLTIDEEEVMIRPRRRRAEDDPEAVDREKRSTGPASPVAGGKVARSKPPVVPQVDVGEARPAQAARPAETPDVPRVEPRLTPPGSAPGWPVGSWEASSPAVLPDESVPVRPPRIDPEELPRHRPDIPPAGAPTAPERLVPAAEAPIAPERLVEPVPTADASVGPPPRPSLGDGPIPEFSPPPSPPPRVEVRIGRIDVRTVSPTTTARPQAGSPRPRPQPGVSLDDYLRRRKGA